MATKGRKNYTCLYDGDYVRRARDLFGGFPEVSDQVVAVARFLETAKSHLGAGDVLLGVFKVLELQLVSEPSSAVAEGMTNQRLFVPHNALLLVGVRVGEAFNLA